MEFEPIFEQRTTLYDANAINLAYKQLRAICNKRTIRILNVILDKKEVSVTEIIVELRTFEQSVVSMHLKPLRVYGLVDTERHGKRVLYSPNYRAIEKFNNIIKELNG